MRRNKGHTIIELLVVLFVFGIFILVIGSFAGGLLGQGYGYLFAKNIEGKVVEISNIQPNAIATADAGKDVLFSSVVAIQTQDETITFSAEDRQWFVVKKDNCVKAKIFPYAPWFFSKAGTYFGGRLLGIVPCK